MDPLSEPSRLQRAFTGMLWPVVIHGLLLLLPIDVTRLIAYALTSLPGCVLAFFGVRVLDGEYFSAPNWTALFFGAFLWLCLYFLIAWIRAGRGKGTRKKRT